MNRLSVKRWFRAIPWKGAAPLAVGILLLGWLLNTPAGLLGKADAVGYAVCHRIDLRSFHLGERPLPLCARCSGMYLAAVIGLVYQSILSRRRGGLPPRPVLIVLGLFVLAFAVDGLNSFASLLPGLPLLYTPQNWIRLLTGAGMGLVIAAFLFPAFNQTVWADWVPQPALPSLKMLFGMALAAGVGCLAVLSEIPVILFPLALISAAGVLIILSIVYCMLGLMLTRRENRYRRYRELALPLLLGFGVALLQIAALDYLRFFITGTWEGFHIN
jgi:uncharacterized membrane protein